MKLTDADVVWTHAKSETPRAGEIRIERHGSDWKRALGEFWQPAAQWNQCISRKADTREEHLLAMFILFNTVTVRDGIDVKKAHDAFLQIEEYCKTISLDAPGAAG